ncbi:hypothetical protein ANO11243_019060 [Dothideomycetidae sp. 11243]|nr:hypothetical protein ANO11243_019060 [fungal sp. No.11243]
MATEKPIHTLVLDTGPIIRNHPTVSSLLAQSEELITVPAIISEIRDATTRSRVETTLVPFLKLRSPSEASMKFVTDFARKTGDAAVLSRVDLQIAALAYEVECERNGGDWRLRRAPGQKRVNGSPPKAEGEQVPEATEQVSSAEPIAEAETVEDSQVTEALANTTIQDDTKKSQETEQAEVPIVEPDEAQESDSANDSDGGEWITPSNLKRKQAQEASTSGASATTAAPRMQVATITTDNALQNLLLQINLNLVSGSLARISTIRTTLLRCHACFMVHKQPDIQFCQRCGKPTLTRVTCTTDASGAFKVHLKKNIQWSHRGERYSIPKPVHGSANGKLKGGGKNGWGNELVLAEDQKEYARSEERRKREEKKGHALMDEDYLPGILTGRRERQGGRMKVGAGRDVNSRKR